MASAAQPGRKRTKRDPVRLLHRQPHRGYTDDPARSAFAEPEAISAEDQAWLTARVRRAERDAQLQHFRERRATIEHEIDALHEQRYARSVNSQLRTLRRQLQRIEQRIAAA